MKNFYSRCLTQYSITSRMERTLLWYLSMMLGGSSKAGSLRYSKIHARNEKEAQELEYRMEMMRNGDWKETKPKLHYTISLINNLVMYVRDAPLEVKIRLIGSIFPEKVQFDGKNYRTKKLNSVLDLIYQQTNELRGQHKKKRRAENSVLQFSAQDRSRTYMPLSTRT